MSICKFYDKHVNAIEILLLFIKAVIWAYLLPFFKLNIHSEMATLYHFNTYKGY